MSEAIENFYNRIYVDFTRDKVWVYPSVIGKGKPEIWTLQQKEQYVNYLKQNLVEDWNGR